MKMRLGEVLFGDTSRAYKKYVARRRRGVMTPAQFREWTIKARGFRERAHNKKIS
jgi:hypothetical protein